MVQFLGAGESLEGNRQASPLEPTESKLGGAKTAMDRYTIDVDITVAMPPSITVSWLQDVARRILEAERVSREAEVGLLLTTDEEVRRLNKEFRGIDQGTDVLSFALQESQEAFPEPPDGGPSLGQVVVSCPQAARQAKEYGHSLEREVAFLVSHGILHLLGYDHQEPGPEHRMRARQEAILTELGLTRDPGA